MSAPFLFSYKGRKRENLASKFYSSRGLTHLQDGDAKAYR